MYDSIYITLWERQTAGIENGSMVAKGRIWGQVVDCKGAKRTFGVMKTSHILIVLAVTQQYTFVKTHGTVLYEGKLYCMKIIPE